MQLTQRDIAIFEFINQFGFCDTLHLCKRFDLTPNRTNGITKRLVDNGYLIKEKEFYGKYALYRLTPQGGAFTALPPLLKLSPGAYRHTHTLIELYLKLKRHYPHAEFISERRLLHGNAREGFSKRGHTPDALLILDEKHIAIEVELTSKSRSRLESILKSYAVHFDIHEVWYFCAKEVVAAVKKVAGTLKFIKVHNLEGVLKERGNGTE